MAEELHYIEFDTERTWREMLETYIDAGGEALYPGDEKEMLLRAALAIAESIMAKVDAGLRMDTLNYAVGEYLKEYGLKRGCAYIEAIQATVEVVMTFASTGRAQTIPAGTALTSDGVMLYLTSEDISLTGGAQTVSTTLICQTAGAAGNGLIGGAQMQFLHGVNGFVSCIAQEDAGGGVDAEDEEAYRERIRLFGLNSVTTGPRQQYESQAKAVSSQIIDARALNEGAGVVGVYLIIDEDASAAALINGVRSALNDLSARPLTDTVRVQEAAQVAYTVNVKVWYQTSADVSDAIASAIQEYSAWQDNVIGRDFNPDKLVAMLYQAGCERVQILEGSGIGAAPESCEYTETDANKRMKGTITLTVLND